MSADPSTHIFWITSRAAGTTALVLSSLAVGFGLTLAGKGGRLGRALARIGASERRAFHESLSLACMVAIAVHGLSLLGDSYLRPSLLDVTVPFVSSYESLATSVGIIAGWALILLGLSYYGRRWIGVARWRSLHRLTLLAWLAGLVHTFSESGTDAGQPWFIALVALTALPAAALLIAHLASPHASRQRVRDARRPAASPALPANLARGR